MSDIENVDNYLDHIFDQIDPSIRLDDEQKTAAVADDDCALVVAGAGTGKTTTIAAKVKYLVDVKHISPKDILIMSYTRKAVEELRRRINVDLDIPAYITTFHSLGLKYLRLLNTDKKVLAIDSNERSRYFLNYFKTKIWTSRENLDAFIALFNDEQIDLVDKSEKLYGKYFLENYKHFSNFDEYFESYVDKKTRETEDVVKRVTDIVDAKLNTERPITIQGERVKSKGEAVIANYLFCNGIDYEYERVYDELVGDFQTYRPDFSLDVGGETIYIEYFGMSGSDLDNRSYQMIRRKKEDDHRKNHNKFIALDYAPNRKYLETLAFELKKLGVNSKPRSIDEIYRYLLLQNPLAELYHLENFFYDIIDSIKTSENIESFDEYKKLCGDIISSSDSSEDKELKSKQLWWIEDFWNYYHAEKAKDTTTIKTDYAEMIKLPRGHLREIIPDNLSFKYILVDEYQDISAERFGLLKETIEASGAKFFAIGDDWQSIFSFQGAKVGYIINFNDYFPGAKRYVISKTYRNAQSLINASGKFVMRNSSQIKKDLRSDKDIYQPVCFVKIKGRFAKRPTVADRNAAIESMIRQIHREHPSARICILGRTNHILKSLYDDSNFIKSAENKVKIKDIENFYFDAMTIHSAKGLTLDWTILMPLTKLFPSDPKKVFWALDIAKNEPEPEAIPYAEQRRLLYVALTRTKNRIYILMPHRGDHSRYKDELGNIIRELEELNEYRAS